MAVLDSLPPVMYITGLSPLNSKQVAGMGSVMAFITMSDIKDEINWEFPGAPITEAQSNYFWQGVIPSGKNDGTTHGNLTDTFINYHEYTMDWQPDTLRFSIDGAVVRTINKSQTIDSAGIPHYPTTPSRVQLSLWPTGISSSATGTVEWAGGMINWNDPDYISAGHFYALVNSITIKYAGFSKTHQSISTSLLMFMVTLLTITPLLSFFPTGQRFCMVRRVDWEFLCEVGVGFEFDVGS